MHGKSRLGLVRASGRDHARVLVYSSPNRSVDSIPTVIKGVLVPATLHTHTSGNSTIEPLFRPLLAGVTSVMYMFKEPYTRPRPRPWASSRP